MRKFKKTIVAVLLIFIIGASFINCNMKVTKIGFLDSHLDEIESRIPQGDSLTQDISEVSVAWHLDHSLKTINGIYDALEASNPEEFDHSFNASRVLSLSMNFIPRGRAQSPASVLPPEDIETEALYGQLEEARTKVIKAFELNENAHFDHPVFGTISRGHALRFIEVHTEHHLKIISDILEE